MVGFLPGVSLEPSGQPFECAQLLVTGGGDRAVGAAVVLSWCREFCTGTAARKRCDWHPPWSSSELWTDFSGCCRGRVCDNGLAASSPQRNAFMYEESKQLGVIG